MIAGLTLLPGRPAFSAAARTDSTCLPRPVATLESVPPPIGQASTAPDSSTNARTTARAPQRPVTSRPSATHGDRMPTPSLGNISRLSRYLLMAAYWRQPGRERRKADERERRRTSRRAAGPDRGLAAAAAGRRRPHLGHLRQPPGPAPHRPRRAHPHHGCRGVLGAADAGAAAVRPGSLLRCDHLSRGPARAPGSCPARP